VVELEGPERVAPNEIGIAFAKILGHPVRMEIVPHASWESLFQSQGMKNPTPRIQMLDGFNEGWIEFEGGEVNVRKGSTRLETVIQTLVDRA
jgi:NAD(P)H dehydrogenase (quinone)